MNIFIDANLPRSLTSVLGGFGKAVHALDTVPSGASDNMIAAEAAKRKAILFTRDLDFVNPHLFPEIAGAGLVVIRVPPSFRADQICLVVQKFLHRTELKQCIDALTVLEPGRVRRIHRGNRNRRAK